MGMSLQQVHNKLQAIPKFGLGGRSSVSGLKVTVFGCTGFLGRYLVNRLGRQGNTLVLPHRGSDEEIAHLKVMGDLGKINLLPFELRDEESIRKCVQHSDVVINLIGKEHNTFNYTIEQSNIEAAFKIARISKQANVSRLIHLSHIKSDKNSKSRFLKGKFYGEEFCLEEFPSATIIRPSTMYGFEDRFLNTLGEFQKMPLGVPLLNKGENIVRPVHVIDVARGITRLIRDRASLGKRIDFYGEKYIYNDIIDIFSDISLADLRTFNASPLLFRMYTAIMLKWKQPLFTPDQILHIQSDEVPNIENLSFSDIGMNKLDNLQDFALRYLRVYRYDKDPNALGALRKEYSRK